MRQLWQQLKSSDMTGSLCSKWDAMSYYGSDVLLIVFASGVTSVWSLYGIKGNH